MITTRSNGCASGGAGAPVVFELVVMAGILGLFIAINLHNLGHDALTYWDESFHALVATNLLDDPLTPILIMDPAVQYDPADWTRNHVWLHKPILPLWTIALSFWILGTSMFALRLPSLVLGAGAVALTYLIGRELAGRRVALVAAAVHATAPIMTLLIHGYAFSDHVDIALLFWVELGAFFVVRGMRTGALSDAALAGAAHGFAVLSKSYVGGIVAGVALAAWLLPFLRLGRPEQTRFSGRHFIVFLIATACVSGPWLAYAAIRFPVEFNLEHQAVLNHIVADVEGWRAPWERVIFDYWVFLYQRFYGAAMVAALVLIPWAYRARRAQVWLLYVWTGGVLVPHLLATSKTPTATLVGMPPVLLLIAILVIRGWSGHAPELGAWMGTTLATLFLPAATGWWAGRGFPQEYTPGMFLRLNPEATAQIVAGLGGSILAVLLAAGARRAQVATAGPARIVRDAVIISAATATVFLVGHSVRDQWTIAGIDASNPDVADAASFISRQLPADAVLLLESPSSPGRMAGDRWVGTGLNPNGVMFHTGRAAYRIDTEKGESWSELTAEVQRADRTPFIMSQGTLPLPVLHTTAPGRWKIYSVPSLHDGASSGTVN